MTAAGRPAVSVVIPTFNGRSTLGPLLDAVAAQAAPFPFEVVAIDSGSTDGTLDLLRARADRVLTVPAGAFNHGLTRNAAIAESRGDLVVLLVQDAVPADARWLAALTRPLLQEATIAGTYARQVPRPGASALTRHYLAGWLACAPDARVAALAPGELEALPPFERYLRCVFDNVCSCLRRAVWEEHPFPAVDIAEDAAWAREVLLAGHRIAYVPDAVVIHSHERPARYELWRTYLIHRRLRQMFGLQTVPTAGHLARAMASSLAVHLRCLGRERPRPRLGPRALARAAALAVAFPLGQYLGARSADTGREYLHPRGV